MKNYFSYKQTSRNGKGVLKGSNQLKFYQLQPENISRKKIRTHKYFSKQETDYCDTNSFIVEKFKNYVPKYIKKKIKINQYDSKDI